MYDDTHYPRYCEPPSLTPETDALVRETLASPTVTDTILAAKLTLKCQELERERDEWRNEHDRVVREYQHRLTVLATSAIEATNYPESAKAVPAAAGDSESNPTP